MSAPRAPPALPAGRAAARRNRVKRPPPHSRNWSSSHSACAPMGNPNSPNRPKATSRSTPERPRSEPTIAPVQAAEKACSKYAPEDRPRARQQQAKEEQALKFSACMRPHGVPNFPDPKFSSGGTMEIKLNGVDRTRLSSRRHRKRASGTPRSVRRWVNGLPPGAKAGAPGGGSHPAKGRRSLRERAVAARPLDGPRSDGRDRDRRVADRARSVSRVRHGERRRRRQLHTDEPHDGETGVALLADAGRRDARLRGSSKILVASGPRPRPCSSRSSRSRAAKRRWHRPSEPRRATARRSSARERAGGGARQGGGRLRRRKRGRSRISRRRRLGPCASDRQTVTSGEQSVTGAERRSQPTARSSPRRRPRWRVRSRRSPGPLDGGELRAERGLHLAARRRAGGRARPEPLRDRRTAVVLLYGSTLARRAFLAGMSAGPDVAELNANLDALGYGTGLARRRVHRRDRRGDRAPSRPPTAWRRPASCRSARWCSSRAPVRVTSVTRRSARPSARPGARGHLDRPPGEIELDAAQQSSVKVGDRVLDHAARTTRRHRARSPMSARSRRRRRARRAAAARARRRSRSTSRRPTRPRPAGSTRRR